MLAKPVFLSIGSLVKLRFTTYFVFSEGLGENWVSLQRLST
jgi:hypothetical protein